jgi:hypothetical protein
MNRGESYPTERLFLVFLDSSKEVITEFGFDPAFHKVSPNTSESLNLIHPGLLSAEFVALVPVIREE